MNGYIEREKVENWLLTESASLDTEVDREYVVERLRAEIPAADVRHFVRGKWILNDESRTVCSLCGNVVAFVSHPDRRWDFGNFCPNCGADMREAPDA